MCPIPKAPGGRNSFVRDDTASHEAAAGGRLRAGLEAAGVVGGSGAVDRGAMMLVASVLLVYLAAVLLARFVAL